MTWIALLQLAGPNFIFSERRLTQSIIKTALANSRNHSGICTKCVSVEGSFFSGHIQNYDWQHNNRICHMLNTACSEKVKKWWNCPEVMTWIAFAPFLPLFPRRQLRLGLYQSKPRKEIAVATSFLIFCQLHLVFKVIFKFNWIKFNYSDLIFLWRQLGLGQSKPKKNNRGCNILFLIFCQLQTLGNI